jgi:hypothetical protein
LLQSDRRIDIPCGRRPDGLASAREDLPPIRLGDPVVRGRRRPSGRHERFLPADGRRFLAARVLAKPRSDAHDGAPARPSFLEYRAHGGVLQLSQADGSRYVLLVNKDSATSRHCAPQFRDPPKQVRSVSPYTGALTDFTGEQMWLAAGQRALLRLD